MERVTQVAKTVELKTKVEPFIRKELEKSYVGCDFIHKSVPSPERI